MKIKISKKITLSISSVVVGVAIISITINKFFVGNYYRYEKTHELNQISDNLIKENMDYILKNIDDIEKKSNVVIVYSEANGDIDSINQDLRTKLDLKKIRLNKFWITEETLKQLEVKSVNKIYDQGIIKYKVLTEFIKKDEYILAIAMPMPSMDETIGIINKFNVCLYIFSLTLIIILAALLSKKIIKPLELIKELSKDIANLNFRREEIKTNDEIEELAISINSMSENLEKSHKEINSQNEMLKTLISDISHEVKTPLALIKAYVHGIEDGLDDGSYIDIIKEQVGHMDSLIENLLFWVKFENKELTKVIFSLNKKVYNVLEKYKLLIEEAQIELTLNINNYEDNIVEADEEEINIVLNNLVSNSLKYTNNNKIEISIFKENDKVNFTIKNGLERYGVDDLENIWTPFYVLEKSRSKELSGTGLGLSIVKKILEKHEFNFGFRLSNEEIEFYIIF